MTTITTADRPDAHRYELRVGDDLAVTAEYRLHDDRIAFTHTETEPRHEGEGLARRLVAFALDDARARGLAVEPLCGYVRKVIADDPSTYLDLVPESERERFDL